MGLPNRETVVARLDALLSNSLTRPEAAGAAARPAVCVVAVDGHEELCALDRPGAEAAMAEIGRRLDRLVRSGDVLGRLAADRFVLVVPSLAPTVAGSLVERITGAVAMPIEVDRTPVSISVTVGLAFAQRRVDAARLVHDAEADVSRIRARRTH
jgi:GGDEF domain-containing protein